MKLEKYKEDSMCEKCGNTSIASNYGRYKASVQGQTIVDFEYIKRTCPRCGYFWHEEPLSKEGEGSTELAQTN